MPIAAGGQRQENSSRPGAAARRAAFVSAYLVNGHNATQAAISAGYSAKTARSQGQRLLTNVDIRGQLAGVAQDTATRADLKIEEALYQVRCALDADPRKLFRKGKLIAIDELDPETAAALDVEIDTEGNVKRRFWSKAAAAQIAFKHLGLFERDNAQQKGANLALQVILVPSTRKPDPDDEV